MIVSNPRVGIGSHSHTLKGKEHPCAMQRSVVHEQRRVPRTGWASGLQRVTVNSRTPAERTSESQRGCAYVKEEAHGCAMEHCSGSQAEVCSITACSITRNARPYAQANNVRLLALLCVCLLYRVEHLLGAY